MKWCVTLPAAALLAGCASTPLGYFEGSGSRSGDILEALGWGFSAIACAVVIIIAGLIVVGTRRSRLRAGESAADAVGREGGGISAIYWGVGLSIPVLVGMAIWTFLSVQALATPGRTPGLAISVTGHRWWWEVAYQSPSQPFGIVKTANELVIPTGVPVRLDLASDDVIHDFWVPKLGPKMDMIPGRTNHSWIEADRPGTYRGQCAEFCGAEHGRMGFVVHALSAADFRTWLQSERQPARLSSPEMPGQQVFERKCVACHTVRGTTAAGIAGPDLTHLGSRTTLAAAMMPNDPRDLDHWLADTQGIKPGAQMPQIDLTPLERSQLVNWLESLK